MADVDDEDDFLYGDSGEKAEELRQSHSTEGAAKEAPEADELLKLYGEDSAGNEQVIIGEGIPKDVAMNGDGDEHEEEENEQEDEDEDGNESDDSIEIVINMDEPIQPPSGISQRTNSLLKIQPGKSTGLKDIKNEGLVSTSAIQRSVTTASSGSGSGVDINAIGTYEGKSILDIDPETLEDKPWRKPGADITDYFNFGFNEHTWRAYCNKQKNLREDQVTQRRINTYESREEQSDNPQGPQPSSAPPPNIMLPPPPFEPILQPGIPIGPGGPMPMGPGFQQQGRGRGFPVQGPAKGGGSGRGGMMGRRDRAVEGVIQLVSSDREERLEEEDQGAGIGQMDGFGGMGEDGFGGDGSGFPMDFHGGPPPFGMFPGDMGPPFGFPQEMPMGFNPDFRGAPRQQIRGGSPMMRGATNPMMMRNQWPPSGPGQPMMRPPSGPGVGQGQGGNMDSQRKRGATNIGLPDDDPYKRRR